MTTMEADGFMYGIGIYSDDESDSQSEYTAVSSLSVSLWLSIDRVYDFDSFLVFEKLKKDCLVE